MTERREFAVSSRSHLHLDIDEARPDVQGSMPGVITARWRALLGALDLDESGFYGNARGPVPQGFFSKRWLIGSCAARCMDLVRKRVFAILVSTFVGAFSKESQDDT
ncbi:MAG: hypothetical protein V3W34_00865 [Phycisphaerae bacterium]